MWPVFPHGLGLRDSFPVSFKWFLALKPFVLNHPSTSSKFSPPLRGGLKPSGELPVRSGDAQHCSVCFAPRGVPCLKERKQLQENPGEPKCVLHIQASGAGSSATTARTTARAAATQLSSQHARRWVLCST